MALLLIEDKGVEGGGDNLPYGGASYIMRLETGNASRKFSILSPRIKGGITEYDTIMKNAKIFDN